MESSCECTHTKTRQISRQNTRFFFFKKKREEFHRINTKTILLFKLNKRLRISFSTYMTQNDSDIALSCVYI